MEFTTDNAEQNKIVNTNNTVYVKKCNNNCGKSIYWDKAKGYFVELDNRERHICPNWNRSANNTNIQEMVNTVASNQSQILQTLNTILTKLYTIESKTVYSQESDVNV